MVYMIKWSSETAYVDKDVTNCFYKLIYFSCLQFSGTMDQGNIGKMIMERC